MKVSKERQQPSQQDGTRALGIVETSSVARGILVADAMCKAAKVGLLFSGPICPGKYLVIVGGLVAEVSASVQAGVSEAGDSLIDEWVIPRVHPQVLGAFTATTMPVAIESVGMIETFSLVAAIHAADQAVKSARVDLLEVRLGRALGGKAYVLLTGEVAAVRAAVQAAESEARKHGLLLGSVVIPSPSPQLVEKLL